MRGTYINGHQGRKKDEAPASPPENHLGLLGLSFFQLWNMKQTVIIHVVLNPGSYWISKCCSRGTLFHQIVLGLPLRTSPFLLPTSSLSSSLASPLSITLANVLLSLVLWSAEGPTSPKSFFRMHPTVDFLCNCSKLLGTAGQTHITL